MLAPLDNFVSYGHENIRNRPDYKQMLVDIYTTSLTSEHLGENDSVNGCKLAESVLLNLRGQVDDVRLRLMMILPHYMLTFESGPSKLCDDGC